MKIQKGKIAIALLALVLVFPAGKMVGGMLEERAMNLCTATPGDSPDFSALVELDWSTMSWACEREYTNEQGEKNGLASRVSFPLIP